MLWAELPLAERFERAAGAGFGAVELWWPGAAAARTLPELTARWNQRLVLLNFHAGDMAARDRGLAGAPARCAASAKTGTPRPSSLPAPATTSPGPRTWPPRRASR